MARVKGNVTPLLSFTVGAGTPEDFGDEVVSVEFTDGDGMHTRIPVARMFADGVDDAGVLEFDPADDG